MKTKTIVPVLFIAILFFLSGCVNKEDVEDLKTKEELIDNYDGPVCYKEYMEYNRHNNDINVPVIEDLDNDSISIVRIINYDQRHKLLTGFKFEVIETFKGNITDNNLLRFSTRCYKSNTDALIYEAMSHYADENQIMVGEYYLVFSDIDLYYNQEIDEYYITNEEDTVPLYTSTVFLHLEDYDESESIVNQNEDVLEILSINKIVKKQIEEN